MVRSSSKRKRVADLAPPTADDSDCDFIPSPIHASSAVRIGYDSPASGLPDNHGMMCSISDEITPAKRQSSLLSFFTKEKKAKQPLSKQKHGHENSMRGETQLNSAKNTNRALLSPTSKNRKRGRLSTQMSPPSPSHCSLSQQKPSEKKSLTQVYIDCGQSKFGQTLCKKCGMLYVPGVLEDEVEHKNMCEAYSLGIPCHRGTIKGGKKIDVLKNNTISNDGAAIVSWRPCVKKPKGKSKPLDPNDDNDGNNDRPPQWPLLAKMISKDLGTHEETTLNHLTNEIVFLCIGKARVPPKHSRTNSIGSKRSDSGNKHRILGLTTVQLLGENPSYRMIGPSERSLTPCKNAKLGIGLLWTHPVCRNQGIATTLVHAARKNSFFGMRVSRQDVAFSNPTQAGYNFALRYINSIHRTERGTEDATREVYDNARRGPLVYEMSL